MDALARSEDRLKQLHDQKVNKLRMFGERMLKLYVCSSVKNSVMVESLLSSSLSAMVVDNHDDMRLMQDIAKNADCNAKSVNFQSGEPDQNLLTVYRSIKVSDPTVLGQLVINNSIEKTALVCTRNEGDELAKNGYSTQYALESNLLDEINRHTQSLDKAKSDLQTKNLSRDITEIEDSMREDDSININVFEDEKREEQARLDILLQQYDGIVEQINAQKKLPANKQLLAHQKKLDYYVGKRAEYIRRDVQEQLHIRLQTALDLNLQMSRDW
ncbi:hypothetical protein BSLG_005887 [Batrachochytrium salamandrivorans]|nr:hypothetical protein BSLG_005887 [Batrachochytrium salamandrivorans]